MRVGNVERDRALDVLGDHLRAGRLTPDEYSARSNRVISAATAADLNSVFTDLPGGFRVSPPGPSAAVTSASSGYPEAAPTYPPPSYEHPNRAAQTQPAVQRPSGFDAQRWIPAAGTASLVLFLLCGFLFGGWAWSWIFFLLPGVLATLPGRR